MDEDEILARKLHEELNSESTFHSINSNTNASCNSMLRHNIDTKLGDPSWELIDPNPDAYALFMEFNKKYFWNKLDGVEMKWSSRMTLCAGVCSYEGRGGLCSIRLSKPLLQLRPRKDLLETLLHEMIHAYLFVTKNDRDRDGHGPEFHKHMNRLNNETGLKITVYHSFHDEVNSYRVHWWRCNGKCQDKWPFYGYVKRSTNKAPSANDSWWQQHQASCSGTFIKIKEPENYKKKEKKIKSNSESTEKVTNMDVPKRPLSSSQPPLLKQPFTKPIKANSVLKTLSQSNLSPDIRQSLLAARSKFLDKLEIKSQGLSSSSSNFNCLKLQSNGIDNKVYKATDIKYWLCNPSVPVGKVINVNFTSNANSKFRKNLNLDICNNSKLPYKTNIIKEEFNIVENDSIDLKGENILKRTLDKEESISPKRLKLDNEKRDMESIDEKYNDLHNNYNSFYDNLDIKYTNNDSKKNEYNEMNKNKNNNKDDWRMMMDKDDQLLDDDMQHNTILQSSSSVDSKTYKPFNDTNNSLVQVGNNETDTKLVECPSCGKNVVLNLINFHLDNCLK